MAATKATAKKTTARKTTARKTAAKKTATRKPAAKRTAKPSVAQTVMADVNETFDDVTDRAEDALGTAVKFARDAAHTYIGMGLVVQERIAQRDFETMSYSAFLDSAKAKGHDRVAVIQGRIEPIAKKVTGRIEPITDRIESNLPKPVKDVIDSGRERVRELLDA